MSISLPEFRANFLLHIHFFIRPFALLPFSLILQTHTPRFCLKFNKTEVQQNRGLPVWSFTIQKRKYTIEHVYLKLQKFSRQKILEALFWPKIIWPNFQKAEQNGQSFIRTNYSIIGRKTQKAELIKTKIWPKKGVGAPPPPFFFHIFSFRQYLSYFTARKGTFALSKKYSAFRIFFNENSAFIFFLIFGFFTFSAFFSKYWAKMRVT